MKIKKTIEVENAPFKYLVVKLRWDDECSNGHKTFSITGEAYYRKPFSDRNMAAGGCIHDEIAKHAPEFRDCIPFHLVSEDGPLHYEANTLYHVECGEFDYARSSAVWPEATEDMLKRTSCETLIHRLPEIMTGFYDMLANFGLLEKEDIPIKLDWLKQFKRTEDDPLPLYTDEELSELREIKAKQKQDRLSERAKKLIDDAHKENEHNLYEAKTQAALLRVGFDPENLIYYKHSGEWCFGWRSPVTQAEKSEFLDALYKAKEELPLDSAGIEVSNLLSFKYAKE